MPETLLTPSSIKMFGRFMTSLQLVHNMHPGPSHNNFLEQQINANDAKLARIYAFSFEGVFYQLPKPAIFVVHGQGHKVGSWDGPSSTLDQAGVAAREWDFSKVTDPQDPDLLYWEYEKGDFSLRLDTEAGPLEQILLIATLRNGPVVSGAGVSGAGVSGAGVNGAGVSGAGVSGAGVSGAGVSGAGVSGAGLRGR
jgi:hypothetical protein